MSEEEEAALEAAEQAVMAWHIADSDGGGVHRLSNVENCTGCHLRLAAAAFLRAADVYRKANA